MKKRYCWKCDTEIFECMGSVHAGSFLKAMMSENHDDEIFELCPKCASFFANTIEEGDSYPQPPSRKRNFFVNLFFKMFGKSLDKQKF